MSLSTCLWNDAPRLCSESPLNRLETDCFTLDMVSAERICLSTLLPSFPAGHEVCFPIHRCSECCDHLTNWYYEKDGKLYCRKHYWEKFGELCHGCSLLMIGPAMVSCPAPSSSPHLSVNAETTVCCFQTHIISVWSGYLCEIKMNPDWPRIKSIRYYDAVGF